MRKQKGSDKAQLDAIVMPPKSQEILQLDASLYMDVICWDCKKRCALSNAVERDGRHYCYRCAGLP